MNEARPWSHTSINKINKIRLTSVYWKIYLIHPKKKNAGKRDLSFQTIYAFKRQTHKLVKHT